MFHLVDHILNVMDTYASRHSRLLTKDKGPQLRRSHVGRSSPFFHKLLLNLGLLESKIDYVPGTEEVCEDRWSGSQCCFLHSSPFNPPNTRV